jgi:predicted RND superfamily exporter protein
MLGGIDNALFLQGLAGYFVVALILIPILKWAFPTSKAVKAERAEVRAMRKEIKKIKKK